MLCIILTKTKLLAGIGQGEGEILYINLDANTGKFPIAHVLSQGLSVIAETYVEYMESQSVDFERPIPTAITVGIDNRTSPERSFQEILKVFNGKARTFMPVHTEFLPQSFLRGLDPALMQKKGMILESFDGQLNVYLNHFSLKGGRSKFKEFRLNPTINIIPLHAIGYQSALQSLVQEATSQFTMAGLVVKDLDRMAIGQQFKMRLKDGINGHHITLNKRKGGVDIKADLSFSDRDYDSAISKSLEELRYILDKDNLKAQGVEFISLLGEFPEDGLRKFMENELELKELLITDEAFSQAESFKSLLSGLNAAALKQQEEKRQEERKLEEQKLEEKRREERQTVNKPVPISASHEPATGSATVAVSEDLPFGTREEQDQLDLIRSREHLMDQVRAVCKDPDKRADYLNQFIPLGEQLQIPQDVIRWNVDEALNRAAQHKKQAKADADQALPMLPEDAEQPDMTLRQGASYEVMGVLFDPEFTSMKILVEGDPNLKVARLLRTWEIEEKENLERFQYLYKKELVYYGELSQMYETGKGIYYYRDFLPYKSLKEHIKKSGLDKKKSLDKYTSKDIKLLLQVLEEVDRLTVSHANLNENNILVARKGLINHHLEIKFVGFTAKDCPMQEMREQVHSIFEALLGAKIYQEFRSKLNI